MWKVAGRGNTASFACWEMARKGEWGCAMMVWVAVVSLSAAGICGAYAFLPAPSTLFSSAALSSARTNTGVGTCVWRGGACMMVGAARVGGLRTLELRRGLTRVQQNRYGTERERACEYGRERERESKSERASVFKVVCMNKCMCVCVCVCVCM